MIEYYRKVIIERKEILKKMTRAYLKYILSLLLFGTNGIVASYILLNSYEIVFLRSLIGSIFLVGVFILSKSRLQGLINKKHLAYLMASGMTMGISWMFLYEAYVRIGVSIATLAYYCGPVIVMVISPFLFNEKLTKYKVFGFSIVLVGMLLVNSNVFRQGGFSWGLIFGILGAVMYAFMIFFNKKAESITGLENSMFQLIGSFLTVMVFVIAKQGLIISSLMQNIIPVILLGVVNTGVGCYLYFSAIQQLPATSVAIFGYLEPLSALIFSVLFLQEKLAPLQILGAIFIIGGAAFGELYSAKNKLVSNENLKI